MDVAGGVNGVALTHLDAAAASPLRVCRAYQAGGRRLTAITPGPERDLAWQERLTARQPSHHAGRFPALAWLLALPAGGL